MARENLSDDELDEIIDDMTEKEILWGIFQQQISATRHLRTIAFTLPLLLALGVIALVAAGV